MNVLVCLLGTRGDVIPALNLIHLLSVSPHSHNNIVFRFTILTHECYANTVLSSFHSSTKYQLHFLHSSPLDFNQSLSAFHSNQELCDILIELLKGCSFEKVICNLFCLEGYLLAKHLTIPCIIIHPIVALVNESIRKEVIQAYEEDCLQNGLKFSQRMDYELWLWPTLTDRYDDFLDRLETSIPRGSAKSQKQIRLKVFITSFSFLIPENYRGSLNEATNVHITGYITPSILFLSEKEKVASLHNQINQILEAERVEPPLFIGIDFGSMTEYLCRLLVDSPPIFTLFLLTILSYSTNIYIIMNCHQSYSILFSTFQVNIDECLHYFPQLQTSNLHKRIIWLDRDINHELYLRHCKLFIHHGGIGTASSVLAAQVRPVIIPFMYDQYQIRDQMYFSCYEGVKFTEKELLDAKAIFSPDWIDGGQLLDIRSLVDWKDALHNLLSLALSSSFQDLNCFNTVSIREAATSLIFQTLVAEN